MVMLSLPLTQTLMSPMPLILLAVLLPTANLEAHLRILYPNITSNTDAHDESPACRDVIHSSFWKNIPQDIMPLNYFKMRSKLNLKTFHTKTRDQYYAKICGRQPLSHLVNKPIRSFVSRCLVMLSLFMYSEYHHINSTYLHIWKNRIFSKILVPRAYCFLHGYCDPSKPSREVEHRLYHLLVHTYTSFTSCII